MPKKFHALCLLNPRSADGAAAEHWPRIAELLKEFSISYELAADPEIPLERRLAERLETETPAAYNAIVGIGGDGTHSAAINALMRYRTAHPQTEELPPYAFLPMGTANNIAKSFGLAAREDFFASDLRRAIAAIIYGADYRMDLGFINGTYFADGLTIGVDSHILHERNLKKQRLEKIPILRSFLKGNLLYALSLAPPLLTHEPIEARVAVDGAEIHAGPIMNLLVKNTRIHAGEFNFCPNTYANDGLLDVVVFIGHKDYLTGYLFALRHNPHRLRRLATSINKESRYTQGKSISVRLARGESSQIDGEEFVFSDSFDISVVQAAVHIKIPAEV